MPIPLPNLDDRTYEDLVAEVRALIPRYAPGWTDHNASDPGVTLLELFAWLAEALIYRVNRVPPASQGQFLKLLGADVSGGLAAARLQAIGGLKTRWRAIAAGDFETLALEHPDFDLVRARCLPELDLTAGDPYAARPGHVSLIVVPAAASQPLAMLNHASPQQAVAYSPDGSRLLSGGDDGVARLWDVASQALLATFDHGARINDLAFSPDGRLAATAGEDGAGQLWQVYNQRRLARLQHAEAVNALAFRPDGRVVATASDDASVKLWNSQNGDLLASLPHGGTVHDVAFAPGGLFLAAAVSSGSAWVWFLAGGSEPTRYEHGSPLRAVAFSPDGTRLATAGRDGNVRLWQVHGAAQQAVLAHPGPLNAVAFSPCASPAEAPAGRCNGRWLATACEDNLARVWDLQTGSAPQLFLHQSSVNDVAFRPCASPAEAPAGRYSGRSLATASSDQTVRVWRELMDSLWDFLDERRLITCRHHVLGAVYTTVRVRTRIVAAAAVAEQTLVERVKAALAAFFDPLSGGPDGAGQGWPFGRNVYLSEVYQVIEETEGVDHAESLALDDQAADGSWQAQADKIDVPVNNLVNFDRLASQVQVLALAT